ARCARPSTGPACASRTPPGLHARLRLTHAAWAARTPAPHARRLGCTHARASRTPPGLHARPPARPGGPSAAAHPGWVRALEGTGPRAGPLTNRGRRLLGYWL